jgi:transposase
MRKSIDGLSAKVQADFALDPFDAALFVFCNRNHNRIKILEWHGDGFWLYFKRLEHGHFRWLEPVESAAMELSAGDLANLIDSAELTQKLSRQTISASKIICRILLICLTFRRCCDMLNAWIIR